MKDQDIIYMYDSLIYITVGLIIKAKKTTALYLTPKRKTSKFSINYINPIVEGIYIDDDYIYVVNDGVFHNAMIPRTYISVYEY